MDKNYKKYVIAGNKHTRGPRMRRSQTRENTYLLQIGLLGDIEMYEKRCWLLRLLDGDEFDADTQCQIDILNNNHMSQCNKNFTINNGNYCAQFQIMDESIFDDEDYDENGGKLDDIYRYNAFVIGYDLTKAQSFQKLAVYMD